MVKNPPVSSVPGSERSPGEGNDHLLYSCLGNPMHRQATVHGVARVRHDLATNSSKPRGKCLKKVRRELFLSINGSLKRLISLTTDIGNTSINKKMSSKK